MLLSPLHICIGFSEAYQQDTACRCTWCRQSGKVPLTGWKHDFQIGNVVKVIAGSPITSDDQLSKCDRVGEVLKLKVSMPAIIWRDCHVAWGAKCVLQNGAHIHLGPVKYQDAMAFHLHQHKASQTISGLRARLHNVYDFANQSSLHILRPTKGVLQSGSHPREHPAHAFPLGIIHAERLHHIVPHQAEPAPCSLCRRLGDCNPPACRNPARQICSQHALGASL